MSFDPEQFMSTSVEGEMSTQETPIPDDEYNALIAGVKFRQAKESYIMDVMWELDAPQLEAITGRKKNQVRQSIFLDVLESGGLDLSKGRNVQLGRLREAVKQNTPRAWAPSMLQGCVAVIRTAQRMEGDRIYTDVKGVRSL